MGGSAAKGGKDKAAQGGKAKREEGGRAQRGEGRAQRGMAARGGKLSLKVFLHLVQDVRPS